MAGPTQGVTSNNMGQPVNVGTLINFTATDAGKQVKLGSGVIFAVTLNKPVATSVITLYDGTSTSGTVLGTITVPASPQPVTLTYNGYFDTGLFVSVGTAGSDFTISYK